MFSHVTVGANHMPMMAAFYDAVLAPLPAARCFTAADGSVVGWRGAADGPAFYVGTPFDKRPATAGNGWMCAFKAASRAAVDAAHAAALDRGGVCEGAPGLRPQYKPGYYGAYFRDPEGNKMHVVCLEG